ncbi:ER membrane protein Wsc4, putative [Beauveria bassiana ARSEF 2860]|uniref:ER membrane protein Wsc4, putative n=1 Tax=Beauveria bassiana (strain ARSEF 2860) TaxID=655819 RepID=J5JLQ1_BEAB2|nr:ER membrane protein Wsc4, putative [Beauveria bassiana ARSEF 2860]EJP66233.1 ER membrane protein Wsc4, putative [Beauveria bassiana ARSEF 2860]
MVMVRIVYFASFLPLVVLEAAALSSLCSTTNTASSKSYSSLYQSRGACGDRCRGQSAYAVVQDDQCWCSDTTPSSTTDDGSCNKPCPGYPQESCGSDGLYSYILLDRNMVKGAPASSSSPSSPSSPPSSSPPSSPPSQQQQPQPSVSSGSSDSSSPSPPPPKVVTVTQVNAESRTIIQTVEAPASSIIEENPATFRTVTVTGTPAVSTIAAVADNPNNNNNDTPSATDSPTPHSDDNGGGGGSGLKQGTIVGIAVGGSAAGVFVGLIAFMVWRRNRYKGDDDGDSGRRQSEEVQGVVDYFGTANGATSIKRDNTSASEDSRMGAFGQNKNLYRNSIGSLEDTSSEWGQVLRVVNPDMPEKQH